MISIIMSSFNADQYLQTSIESIIDQSYSHWELIIVDDGSLDQTGKLLTSFKDPRIRSFYQEKQGVSAARNLGLRHMSGDYFCFLDADDFMPRESLESRLKVFLNNPEVDFVDGTVHIYDQALQKKRSEWTPRYRGNPLDQLLSLSDTCFFGNSWMIKRDKKKTYQFHENLSHGEDLLFFIELALQGGQYDFTDQVILYYRKGHTSAMTNIRGLEDGYRYIYQSILNMYQGPSEKAEMFKRKARNILWKSYLGRSQPFQAVLSQVRKWQTD